MAASPCVAAILRDASLRDAPQDEVFETRVTARKSVADTRSQDEAKTLHGDAAG
jgi:hypothetical protein